MTTEKIWDSFHDKLKSFIHKRVRDEETAKDLLQDVFIRVHKNISSLKDDNKLNSWIYQITRNVINDYYRKTAQTVEVEIDLKTEDNMALEEISTCLYCLINALPKEYKRAVYLSEIKGISQKEVARILDISYTATKSRVQRGRKLLKEKLSNCSSETVVFGTEACKVPSK